MQYKKALVVDDSRVARVTLKKKLEQYGLAVDMAESAQEAIDYLHQNQADIIFMDYMMPEVDGLEATRRIKADPAIHNVPVIICSGREDDDYSDQARALGASDILAKPPATEALEGILNTPAGTLLLRAASTAPAAAPGEAPVPLVDESILRTLLDEALSPRLAEYREEFQKQLQDVQASVMEAVSGSVQQNLAGLERRLNEIATRPAPELPDFGEMITALEERVSLQSAELQHRLEAQIQSQSPAPLVEELQARVRGDMEEQRRQTTEALDRWGERIGDMADRLQQVVDKAAAVESAGVNRVEALQQRLDTVEAAQAAAPSLDIDTAFFDLERRLDQRLTELREAIAGEIEQQSPAPQLARLEEKLRAGLRDEESRLHKATEEWGSRFDGLAKDIGQISQSTSSALDRSGEQLERLQERLGALESSAPAPVVDAILDAAEKKFSERTTELQARFQAQLESQSPVLTRIQGQIEDQGRRFKEAADQWGQRVDSLAQDVSAMSDAISSSDVSHERRFGTLQERVESLESAAPAPVVDAILGAAEDKFALRINELQRRLEEQSGQLANSLAEQTQRLEAVARKAHETAVAEAQAQGEQDRQIGELRDRLDALVEQELPSLRSALTAMEDTLSQRVGELRAVLRDEVETLGENQLARLGESLREMAARFDAMKEESRDALRADTEQFADTIHEELEKRILQARTDVTAELQLQFGNQLRRLHSTGTETPDAAAELAAAVAQAEKRNAELLTQMDKTLVELREQLSAQPTQIELQSRRLLEEAAARTPPPPPDTGLNAKLNRIAIFAGIGVVASLAVAILAYLR